MFHKIIMISCLILTIITGCLIYKEAEARLGGGRSFGGKTFMNRPYSRPVPSSPTMRQQTMNSQQMQQGTATAPSRGFGGLGGIFGGLLAGTLIGSLLSGNGFSGGGFLDLILIVGLVYIAYRLFFRKKSEQSETAVSTSGYVSQSSLDPNVPISRSSTTLSNGMGWEVLKNTSSNADATTMTQYTNIPEEFNEEEFLAGAKATYVRLNTSWDHRDLKDIAQFTTPAFLDELKQQLAADPNPEQTEIMLVNASVVEFKYIQNEAVISVYFNVLLRENKSQDAPIEVREIWHFVRPISGDDTWKLDGIQQVEHV